MASNRNPVGTFTARHSDGTIETLIFSADKSADVTHTLTWRDQPAASNSMDRGEARRILKVWTVTEVLI